MVHHYCFHVICSCDTQTQAWWVQLPQYIFLAGKAIRKRLCKEAMTQTYIPLLLPDMQPTGITSDEEWSAVKELLLRIVPRDLLDMLEEGDILQHHSTVGGSALNIKSLLARGCPM